jgi:hypothetical protein
LFRESGRTSNAGWKSPAVRERHSPAKLFATSRILPCQDPSSTPIALCVQEGRSWVCHGIGSFSYIFQSCVCQQSLRSTISSQPQQSLGGFGCGGGIAQQWAEVQATWLGGWDVGVDRDDMAQAGEGPQNLLKAATKKYCFAKRRRRQSGQ